MAKSTTSNTKLNSKYTSQPGKEMVTVVAVVVVCIPYSRNIISHSHMLRFSYNSGLFYFRLGNFSQPFFVSFGICVYVCAHHIVLY